VSQENVELARRGYAALNEAYKSGNVNDLLPIAEEMWDPDIVFRTAETFVESGEWIQNRKTVRMDVYESKAEALEAVGLRE
jgi:hypothetical protein